MSGNCYGCRFAIDQRDHVREGEQVRCAKAEELFGTNLKGGKRWVDVRRSEKTGKLLKAKCGTFESITPADFQSDAPEVATKAQACCPVCKGSGLRSYKVGELTNQSKCYKCQGKG